MCGRVNVSDHKGVQNLLEWLNIPLFPEQFTPRYNITPGSQLLSIFNSHTNLESSYMEWGIVPRWAKPDQPSRILINARAESIWDKPSFRNLIKDKRIIIPVNGFYEWKREGKNKTAYHIHAPDENALALGGIYQISAEGVMQCCVVTTAANQNMARIHDRMPMILSRENMKDWLLSADRQQLDQLMLPAPDNSITLTPVSPYVNNSRHEGPRCVEEVQEQNDLFSN